ncbi:MAG: sulfatase-like hydrolase/transferase [Bacteroidales bacterium]|nr:MAG: sulfatase-like hydrolase/transferase [Bacteroidales bacterium]
MKPRLQYFITYILFWYTFFIICKLLFLCYHNSQSFELSFIDWSNILVHGIRLDLSSIGYILAFPVVVLMFTSFLKNNLLYYVLNVYTLIIIVTTVVFTTIDLELYKYWGFRLDNTPLLYINKPGEMLASVRWDTLVISLVFIVGFSAGLICFYLKYIAVIIKNIMPGKLKTAILFLLILPSLIIPVRGGFDTSPVNLSAAYFHENSFANHAAVNLLWNIGFSFTNEETSSNPFIYYEEDEAKNIVERIYVNGGETNIILNTGRPNIILVIMESFTSKIIEPLGGKKYITPNFNRLVKEGVLFSNLYASGSRSDKGLAAIFSGYPAHGITSIMKFPQKTQSLPFISRLLSDNGYKIDFYYGGDIDFFNLRAYLINGGFKNIISKEDFPSSRDISKWGIPDHIMFERFLKNISSEPDEPFFKVLFTLSNHEPFDVPVKDHFKGDDIDTRLFNSAFYADSCIGSFVAKAKTTDWWDNTLMIFVSDHGNIYPDNTYYNNYKTHAIPMLWLGGAVRTDTVISSFASQTDIPKTLLNQLGLPADMFEYSRNILSGSYYNFAFYAYNNGFGYVSDSVKFSHDNVSGQTTVYEGAIKDEYIMQGRAFMQVTYDDFLSR